MEKKEKKHIKLKTGKGDKTIDVFFGTGFVNKKTIGMIKIGVQKAFKFFNQVEKVNFRIDLVSSRSEFDKKIGFKTEDWFIGNSFGNKFMIFSPETIEKETSHKKNEFIPLIAHETAHILHKKINPNFSHWMSEGIAQNIAEQKTKKDIKPENIKHFLEHNLFQNSDYREFISHQGYEISNKLTKFFIDHYSKKQVMDLLKIKYSSSPVVIEKKFCDRLRIDKNHLILAVKNILKD
ncbi:MAG: hypothetical protein WDZ85_02185 [Candidatus Paceibacterota bacterium]